MILFLKKQNLLLGEQLNILCSEIVSLTNLTKLQGAIKEFEKISITNKWLEFKNLIIKKSKNKETFIRILDNYYIELFQLVMMLL